jgi:hypothetical protein
MVFTVIDQLPGTGRRNLKQYLDAAAANPGKWVVVEYPPDEAGSIVSNLRRYGLEAYTRQGVIYCRAPEK